MGRRNASGRVVPGHVFNGVLAALLVAATLCVLFVLPLGLTGEDRRLAWLLLPAVLLTSTHWALLHEAIHGLFHPTASINRMAGRLLAASGGSSFRVLRFGHLMHHRFNRYRMDRPDCYDPRETSVFAARYRYFAELLGGLYLIEVAIPLLFLLPEPMCRRILDRIYADRDETVQQVAALARQTFIGRRQLRELRQDAILIVALFAAASWAWGADWPLLLAFLLGRGLIISFCDNVHHYGTPLDAVDFAHNLRLPAPLRAAMLNMNLHRVHHREPNLPWWRLPGRFRERADHYDADYARAALRQFGGPAPIDRFAPAKDRAQEAA